MKPVIGITMTTTQDGRYAINEAYVESVLDAGGIPYCIPFGVEGDVEKIMSIVDGLLLTGGVDVHPHFFSEEPHPKLGEVMIERDKVEMYLLHEAVKRKLPIFGICRGIQLLNVGLGGTLYQDIQAQYEKNPIQHSQLARRAEAAHYVKIEKESKLYLMLKKEKISVNSFHHQAIKDVAETLTVVAKSSDGIVEAVEMKDYPFGVAVQWHPEEMAQGGDPNSLALFKEFVEVCTKKNSLVN